MWFHSPNKKSEILKIYLDEITERPSNFIRAVFVYPRVKWAYKLKSHAKEVCVRCKRALV